jgi:hypothetical protein
MQPVPLLTSLADAQYQHDVVVSMAFGFFIIIVLVVSFWHHVR